MADEEFPDEEELRHRQTTGLYPVGRALRTTFNAENHDTLGTDLTGLMLELARIEPDEAARVDKPRIPPAPAAMADPPPPDAAALRSPWWRRWLG